MIKNALLISIFVVLSGCSESITPLPKLDMDLSATTVSGISSGGYMAHQYHIAYSDQVVGAGLFASGPYGCSEGDLEIALANCVDSREGPDAEKLADTLRKSAAEGMIAALENLKADKVWIFHGSNDTRVSKAVTRAQEKFYQLLQLTPKTEYSVPSGHGFPTQSYGVDCDTTKSPHINQCDYDAAGELLNYFYSDLKSRSPIKGKILAFDQAVFLPEEQENTLADLGYLFVPQSCLSGEKCRLHIAFHGCSQNQKTVGMAFIENAGYNAWAEANNIVVLYPQAKGSYLPLNPKACWDWWGYSGANFQYRNGTQLKHINRIVRSL